MSAVIKLSVILFLAITFKRICIIIRVNILIIRKRELKFVTGKEQ